MLKFLFRREFSLFEAIGLSSAASLMSKEYYITGVIVFLVTLVINALGEYKLKQKKD